MSDATRPHRPRSRSCFRSRAWRLAAAVCALWTLAAAAAPPEARLQAVFGPGRVDADGRWILSQEKVLRMPGTSRERARLPAGTTLGPQHALTVKEGGQAHDLLLWDGRGPGGEIDGGFGGEVAVLAVFAAGQTAPIDVAEVKTDRFTALAAPPALKLSADDDAFVVLNTHANAGQPYTSASLFHLRGGRLRRIAVVDLLGELSGCAKAFDEVLDWRTEPDLTPLPVIVARVTLVHAPAGSTQNCEGRRPAERREVFEDRWRWSAAQGRYVHQGGTLSRLARWNDERR